MTVIGMGRLLLVWISLLALLALTVTASFQFTGPLNLSVSICIALAKATLIFWFFMRLREEGGLLRLIAVGAGAWLIILLLLAGTDYATRGRTSDVHQTLKIDAPWASNVR
ncbi:MAG: cytochrome C oxidase subunit IV family protein [Rhodomicrobiaceae bacterium]